MHRTALGYPRALDCGPCGQRCGVVAVRVFAGYIGGIGNGGYW